MAFKLKIPMILFLFTILVSCGGGGGDTTTGGEDSQPDVDTQNPSLSGKILFIEDNTLYAIDAETGDFYSVPNTNWRQQNNRFLYPSLTKFSVSPVAHSGTVFVGVGKEVEKSYVFLQDYNGTVLWQFDLAGEVLNAKLSQDRQYIILFRRLGSVSSVPWLEMYSVNGDLLADKQQYTSRQIFWLKDNRLLYSNDRSFHFTKSSSIEDDYSLTLPDPEGGIVAAGYIGDKSISPDESQIVFTVGDPSSYSNGYYDSRLYIMNMDGTGLRLLATNRNDETPTIIQPSWSPDGRWILVKAGYRQSGVAVDTYSLGYRYLIPADDPEKVYYVDNYGNDKSPEVSFFNYRNINTSQFTTRGGDAVFTWIPD
jgi:hypothetical protein